ncbi:MAG TPA: TIR domain-containing protein [Sphingomicrobium sp.]
MPGTDVFLSYSREDRASARHIADCFAAEGISVWWDARLQSGQTFDEVIERQLKEAKAVVVLWTPRSVNSRWVRAEATLADRKNKLVPAIIEPCDRPIAFELTHTADLSDWTGDISDTRWRDFVHDVRRLVTEDSDEAPAKPRAPAPQAAVPAPPRSQLRPGNDDVIFAATKRAPVADLTRARTAPVAAAPSAESDDEDVHCLALNGDSGDRLFFVGSAGVKIGRTAPADVVLPDRSVSREHCVIGLANDELLVTDLNSTNGTYIDDQRVGRATVLPVGSVLRVGEIELTHEVRPRSDAPGWDESDLRAAG